jgi:BON domain
MAGRSEDDLNQKDDKDIDRQDEGEGLEDKSERRRNYERSLYGTGGSFNAPSWHGRGSHEPGGGTYGEMGGFGEGNRDQWDWVDEGPFAGRGPQTYRRLDDRIQQDIYLRLRQQGGIDASKIEVSVIRGLATLKGSVDSPQAKRLAEDVAGAVSGVTDIDSQLQVEQKEAGEEAKQRNEQER